MKIVIPILCLFVLLLSGCASKDTPIVGNDKDIHGCIGSAGYSWCDVKQKCLRSFEENCSVEINNTVEVNETILPNDTCTDNKSNSLSLAEAITIAKASECGDRLITECSCPTGYRKDGNSCNPECYYSTPKCLIASQMCKNTYSCNVGTGTYWIKLNLSKEGCYPMCVVNVATKTAEINGLCTGLVIPKEVQDYWANRS